MLEKIDFISRSTQICLETGRKSIYFRTSLSPHCKWFFTSVNLNKWIPPKIILVFFFQENYDYESFKAWNNHIPFGRGVKKFVPHERAQRFAEMAPFIDIAGPPYAKSRI